MIAPMMTAPGNTRVNDVDPKAAIQAADAKARAAVVQSVGGQAPEAAILPSTNDVVLSAVSGAVAKLTDGDVTIPVTATATEGRLSPEAFTALVGWQGMVDGLIKQGVTEAAPYKIDAKAAAVDGDKLIEVATLIQEASSDKGLLAAIRRAPKAGKGGGDGTPSAKEPAKAPEKPDMALEMARTMLDRRNTNA